jgi:putative membrane-bound dehydrogenase-like protein
MTRLLLCAGLLVLVHARLSAADPKPADRPLPPTAAAKAMTLPDGFKATLFAGEPDIVQPIAMAFDTRGRLWVVECLSYPKWRHDGKGNDRVVILEDTDADGKHDKKTVFLDNGVNLSGIEVGFGGVWLCSSPNLVFVPDKNRDDKPDGPPEVVLDGWNIKDTKHNVFSSLAWGPDGWLYGCNGIQAKAKVGRPGTPEKDRVALDCGVWRYHPTRKVFELVASGTTNPWGLDWDEYGQIFITNCVIHHIFHMVPGGHYDRMYGEDVNPFTYGLMKTCADHLHWGGGSWTSSRSTGVNGSPQHSEAGGGHAHVGCSIYLGDNFPEKYRNTVFMCNLHGNRLNNDRLERTASGYVAKHDPDFLFANDAWFRGLVVKYGPDGGLYVSDWTDTGECHNYEVADTSNGRIYKVVYGTPKPFTGDVAKLTDAELIKLQLSRNEWLVRQARLVLQGRAAAGKLEEETVKSLGGMARNTEDVAWKLRAMWALHAVGGVTPEDIAAWLRHDSDHVRAWAILLADEPEKPSKESIDLIIRGIEAEESQFALLLAAGAVQRLDRADAAAAARAFVKRVLPEDDSNLALACWYTVQSVLARTEKEEDALALLERARHPLIARNIARYLVASAPKDQRDARLGLLIEYLDEAGLGMFQLPVLLGMQDALAGLREYPEPKGWKDLYPALVESDDMQVRGRAEALAVLFGNQKAIADLKSRMTDAKAEPAARAAAIELLTRRRVDGLASMLHGLLDDAVVRGAAIRALAAYPDNSTPAKILATYPKLNADEKRDAVQTLASRAKWADALLDAIEKKAVPRPDVSLVAARQIQALSDKALTKRLAQVWGVIRPAAKDQVALQKKWRGVLTTEALRPADRINGRRVYAQHCGACHKLFGEGGDIGPDLTGSQRTNLDYVLENVLDPSAIVPREYRVTNFTLTDGRLVSGIVTAETPDGVTVRTANETIVLPAADIESRKQTNQSIMPEGQFDVLKPDEVRDLIAYLISPHQVPLPDQPK